MKLCPKSDDVYILCRSRDLREKEKAMHERFVKKTETELEKGFVAYFGLFFGVCDVENAWSDGEKRGLGWINEESDNRTIENVSLPDGDYEIVVLTSKLFWKDAREHVVRTISIRSGRKRLHITPRFIPAGFMDTTAPMAPRGQSVMHIVASLYPKSKNESFRNYMKLFVKYGGDPNLMDNTPLKCTPFEYAVDHRRTEDVKIMIQAGANVNRINEVDDSYPLKYAVNSDLG